MPRRAAVTVAVVLALAAASAGNGRPPAGVWWSFRPLVRPPVPTPRDPHAAIRNPIDAFIRARLEKEGLTPAPEADRRTLIRRVTFDLTGLPPTPAEVAAFVADPDPLAYERLVDRLLASPAYGERQARFWMDIVHFAETHGHETDSVRPNAWRYRDYLVAAFNADTPYARFIQEQIAADVLFPDEPWLTPALGFIAAGPWDESSLKGIREDSLDRVVGHYLDRDDMVTTVIATVQSLTVHCARCHDHKFDPISQADYYGLQADFAGVDRADRAYDPDPRVGRRRRELRETLAALDRHDPALAARLAGPEFRRELAAWEAATAATRPAWTTLSPTDLTSDKGATLTRLPDGSVRSEGKRPEADTYTITTSTDLAGITAVRLEVLADDALPHHGPGRADNGNLHLSEFKLSVDGKPVAVRTASADYDQPDWTAQHAIDGKPKTAWGIHPQEGRDHEAVFELAEPVGDGDELELTVRLEQLHGGGHVIGRFQLSATTAARPVVASKLPAAVRAALAVPSGDRSAWQWQTVGEHYLRETTAAALAALPPPTLVYAAAHDFTPDGSHKPSPTPRPVHVLKRGDVTRAGPVAHPGALSCLPGLPGRFDVPDAAPEHERRAALAHWLTRPDNPLTWRSIVNRAWQSHFGRGIVDTPNDFGKMGSPPSHPDLLDWLAADFRDSGGSLKRLHRLIVTSATYRQSSAGTSAADPDNRLLAHMTRGRLDAEQVRDAILAVSGRLDRRMGGPSDQQFTSRPGVEGRPVVVDYAAYQWDRPEGHRRSVYRFAFRTLADPFVECLDGADAAQLTPVRNVSVTGPQALALLNNDFVLTHSKALAALLEGRANRPRRQVELACERVWGRPPTAAERAEFVRFVRQYGLANVCRVLFNSNEFLFVD
ncbi:MAG TPA: DUF1549 and DUF1553 domain-containing protein [Gemmataceae bacterium]|jgi:hypothetical protein